jgi:hypothetical protein
MLNFAALEVSWPLPNKHCASIRTAVFLPKSKALLTHSVFRHAGGLLAQRASSADEGYVLMGVSNTDTIMTALEAAANKEYSYSPYGHRPARNESNIPWHSTASRWIWQLAVMPSAMGIVCTVPHSKGFAALIILVRSGKVG